MTFTVKGETYTFVSFGGGNKVTARKDGKFYNFKVESINWNELPINPQVDSQRGEN